MKSRSRYTVLLLVSGALFGMSIALALNLSQVAIDSNISAGWAFVQIVTVLAGVILSPVLIFWSLGKLLVALYLGDSMKPKRKPIQ